MTVAPPTGLPVRGEPEVDARPYPQLMRGLTYRWWRPLLSLVGGVLITAGVLLWFAIAASLIEGAFGADGTDVVESGPIGFVLGNLLIALGTPVAMAAIGVAFLRPPQWMLSVELRMRWRWFASCVGVLVVWALAASAVWFVLDGPPDTGGEDALLLIVLCLLTTPLQAAGEEFLVRGWISQSIAAWFSRPLPGAVAAGLVSAVIFAFLHGSQNVWLFGDRLAFGLIASYLAWRTGGLEAPIALHTVGNISAIIPAALEGTLDEALLISEAPVGQVIVDVGSLLLAAAAIVFLARRLRVRRLGPAPAGS